MSRRKAVWIVTAVSVLYVALLGVLVIFTRRQLAANAPRLKQILEGAGE